MVASILAGSSRTALPITTLLLSLWTSFCHGLDISYCSTENNAGGYQGVYSEFQSNGLCQTNCQGSFAFAVLQGNYCWCSNYVPEPQQNTLDCNQQCPGFTSEWCGSTQDSLYGYYLLSAGVPLGTSGSGSGSGSSTPSSTSSPSSSPSIQSTSSSPPPPPPPPPPSSSAPPSSSPSPTPTPTPTEIYTSVTTVTGEVRTVVVTPSPTTSSDAILGQSSTSSGLGTGKVAGIVVGVTVGIGSLVGVAVWLWFRRRHRKAQEERGPETAFVARSGDGSPSNNLPSRQVSQMSTAGLLGAKVPHITTSGFMGNDPRVPDAANLSASDRRSVGTDQRLNPYALYMNEPGRASDVSLQDNHDYSRQLRVANPDH
ncbi:Cell wall integrity and stress response component 4 [Cladophialophora chaetospira]|uniref:Cell wall integrity and stress response component 4 n=1 Tax=Cladophialophora chaetospira TaxID=386627 RepID=A0AA38XFF2_9EURO|nr:Cell wall integrity and stress response component 4 [Cladophialophora chaetospira]